MNILFYALIIVSAIAVLAYEARHTFNNPK